MLKSIGPPQTTAFPGGHPRLRLFRRSAGCLGNTPFHAGFLWCKLAAILMDGKRCQVAAGICPGVCRPKRSASGNQPIGETQSRIRAEVFGAGARSEEHTSE